MKKMTCKELGGPCDEELSAETWKKLVAKMTAHLLKNHPEVAERMKKAHD